MIVTFPIKIASNRRRDKAWNTISPPLVIPFRDFTNLRIHRCAREERKEERKKEKSGWSRGK